jgi:hypothetical protein
LIVVMLSPSVRRSPNVDTRLPDDMTSEVTEGTINLADSSVQFHTRPTTCKSLISFIRMDTQPVQEYPRHCSHNATEISELKHPTPQQCHFHARPRSKDLVSRSDGDGHRSWLPSVVSCYSSLACVLSGRLAMVTATAFTKVHTLEAIVRAYGQACCVSLRRQLPIRPGPPAGC